MLKIAHNGAGVIIQYIIQSASSCPKLIALLMVLPRLPVVSDA